MINFEQKYREFTNKIADSTTAPTSEEYWKLVKEAKNIIEEELCKVGL